MCDLIHSSQVGDAGGRWPPDATQSSKCGDGAAGLDDSLCISSMIDVGSLDVRASSVCDDVHSYGITDSLTCDDVGTMNAHLEKKL